LDLGLLITAAIAVEVVLTLLTKAMAFGPNTPKILAPVEVLALVAAATLLLRRRGETWRALAFARPVSAGRTAGLVGLGYLGVIVMNALIVLVVLPRLHAEGPNLSTFGAVAGRLQTFLFWLAIAWTTAAVGEELLFRGFVWSRFERLVGGPHASLAALVLQALLFGLAHGYQGLAGMLATFGVGLVLGLLRRAARSNLLPGMILHALVDTVSLTAVFLGLAPKSLTG
jgi:membrane protease YdiL (CAAX protease family)